MAQWQTVAQKRACGRFDANEKKLGREIGSGHRACLQRRAIVQTTLWMCRLQQAFAVASSDILGEVLERRQRQTWQMDGRQNDSLHQTSPFPRPRHSCDTFMKARQRTRPEAARGRIMLWIRTRPATTASSSKCASRAKSTHFASNRLIFGKSGPDWAIFAGNSPGDRSPASMRML